MEIWMVRAGNNNELINKLKDASAIGIGWTGVSDASKLDTREKIKEAYRLGYPEESDGSINVGAGMLHTFVNKIQVGDLILTYNQSSRMILIGKCKSDYKYNPKVFGEDYSHIREVDWTDEVSRDDFSAPARNSMGSVLTVFNLSHHSDEIMGVLHGEKPTEEEQEETVVVYEEVKAQSDELIADELSKLDGYEFQYLVGAVLRAMGLKTVISPPGRDRGVDIVATPDDLGFGPPLIKVQVKHTKSSIGAPEVKSFLANLKDDEKGLFVSTGGFSNEVEKDHSIATRPLTCLDRNAFIELFLKYYEDLEPQYQAKIPLKNVYLPIR